ncbi:uncharacterized protein LOC135825326 [Sycon ciliatum]|uniref:uncharacterized protein LOC135825326 n=1 Tax=Sycon ciliatum TaxID=27933 RepID=UPI0031F6EAB6
MEQESAQNVLNSVNFDVWEAAVLPLLSFADIFQLCGVTRRVRELLHKENTFRRLCENRYQISPHLKLSYIRVAKHLCIATRVSSIHERNSRCGDNSVVDSNFPHHHDQLCKQKFRAILQLSSLALTPPKAHTIMRYSPPLPRPLIKTLWLPSKDTSFYLSNLPTSLIEETCRLEKGTKYSLDDATSLLLKICGSHEEYQTCILKKLEQDIPETEAYLPYANRTCKLVELAKCFESVARRDPTLLSSLKCENLVPTLPQHVSTRWIYNPYDYILIENDKSDLLSDDVLATHNWIDFTVRLAERHSVLKLLIKRILRVSQVEDYFVAVMEYDKLWHSLSQSRRPSRDALYRDLGTYLLHTLPTSQCKKELTKVELLNAMERCGKMIVGSATPEVRLSERASCCNLM